VKSELSKLNLVLKQVKTKQNDAPAAAPSASTTASPAKSVDPAAAKLKAEWAYG
jgi:hypothetical protein